MDDLDKERIRFNIEFIKLLALLFITTGGGGLMLMVDGLYTPAKFVLGAMGTFFAFTSGVLAIVVYKNTLKKLNP